MFPSRVLTRRLVKPAGPRCCYVTPRARLYHSSVNILSINVTEVFSEGFHDLRECRHPPFLTIWTEAGEFEEALKSFDEVLGEDPEHVSAMVLKAYCLEKLYYFEEAIEFYDKGISSQSHKNNTTALEKEPNDPVSLFNKATIEMKLGILLTVLLPTVSGRVDNSLQTLAKCIEVDPKNIGAYTNQGILLQTQGKLEEAMDCYKKSLEISPDAGTHLNLGKPI